MVASGGQRGTPRPAVGLRVVHEVPVDRALVGKRVAGRAADAVQDPVERDARDRSARRGQRGNAAPRVGSRVPHEALGVGPPVLLDEAADRVELAVEEHYADVVRAAGQRRRDGPAVDRRVVDLVVGPVDALLAVAAGQVHPVGKRGRPGHLAARQRQRRARDPAPRRRGLRRHAVEDVLLRGELGLVDAPRLLQAFVEAAVRGVVGRLRECTQRRQDDQRTGDEGAAARIHGMARRPVERPSTREPKYRQGASDGQPAGARCGSVSAVPLHGGPLSSTVLPSGSLTYSDGPSPSAPNRDTVAPAATPARTR